MTRTCFHSLQLPNAVQRGYFLQQAASTKQCVNAVLALPGVHPCGHFGCDVKHQCGLSSLGQIHLPRYKKAGSKTPTSPRQGEMSHRVTIMLACQYFIDAPPLLLLHLFLREVYVFINIYHT